MPHDPHPYDSAMSQESSQFELHILCLSFTAIQLLHSIVLVSSVSSRPARVG
jgi:hypothetical protein